MDTETRLRDAFAVEAGALDVPNEVWPRFARRERTAKRNRRIRLGVVAATIVAAAGVQTTVIPLPGWAPGIAVAGAHTALTASPIRGSLAGDEAFLRGMRAAIKDVEDPGETWKIKNRSQIQFLYAGDVGDHRLTLSLVPLRFGFLTDHALIWYEGPAGATPDRMTESGRTDGGDTVSTWSGGDVAVVVAPGTATMTMTAGFRYTPEGRVDHGSPRPVGAGGVAEIVPPATSITVTDHGRTLAQTSIFDEWTGPDDLSGMVDRALAGRPFDRDALAGWVESAMRDARVPTGTTLKVRWTGTVNNQPAALFTLHPPGGGVLAYAFHGVTGSYRQDMRLLLPAAGADTRPIAWRLRAEGKDDRTDRLLVVAPPGSTSVSVTGGAPIPVDAAGFATTTWDPGAVASVTARPSGAITPVPPFETDLSGLPGDTPKTRLVP